MVSGDADEQLAAWQCEDSSRMEHDPTSQPLAESSRLSDDLEEDVGDDLNGNEPASPGAESSDSLNDFSHGSVSSVEDVQETSLTHPADGPIEDNTDDPDASDTPVTYTVVEGATRKGRDMLVSSTGYSYTVKPVKQGNGQATHWRCTKRNGSVDCRAIVTQKGEQYQAGFHSHCHPPELSATLQAQVTVQLRTKAREQVFEPASELVDEILLQAGHHPGLPSQAALLRRVNRAKAKMRPKEPKDLEDLMNFQLDEHYIPEDFLRADIPVGVKRRRRHILLATQQQLDLLGQSNSWYMDGTFKVARPPFVQLLSVHAFLKHDGNIKMVPLAFGLMSGKAKGDYRAILSELLDALPDDIQVQECVVDYEDTLWRVVPQLLPTVRMRGCSFHWKKVVWWHAQQCGLQKPYMEDERIHRWLRRLLALPYLPAACIPPAFEELRAKARGSRQLTELADYVDNTWLSGSLWTPRRWSVYGLSVRTTNDVEGWHNRLNLKAKKPNLPMYLLISLLHRESQLVAVYTRQVPEGNVRRYQRATYRRIQGRLFTEWEKFAAGETTAKMLLEVCSKIFGPPGH
ncbi:uncharacterized protein [Branchiostoma lanceolatum]